VGEPLPAAAVAAPAARPIREVLASPDFRRYWLAQFLAALGNGALRFVFVWLALDLSDSDAAPGLLGMALGLPGLVLMVPAGAWSDRLDRRRLIVGVELAAAAVLGAAAAVTWADVMSIPLAAVFAVATGGVLAVSSPALQALVPSLVRPHRLMTGVALQGMGQNAALLFGAAAGGGAIALAGVGGAFALLGALQGIAAGAMARVRLPDRVQQPRRGMRGDIGDGLRFALGGEPLRSLLGIGLLAGFTWGIVSILLPEVAKDELGTDAFRTSLLFSALGVGLVVTSMVLASRHDILRPGLLIACSISTLLGGGVLVMGLSRSYLLTFAVMLAWGVGGGITVTLQRGLLQRHTPDDLMGRVMGLSSVTMIGSFPLAAAVASGLSSALGAADALVVVGLGALAVSAPLGWRRAVRSA
jgi:MFS transporter, ENTS family, enterobactin (siderophore) exporter